VRVFKLKYYLVHLKLSSKLKYRKTSLTTDNVTLGFDNKPIHSIVKTNEAERILQICYVLHFYDVDNNCG